MQEHVQAASVIAREAKALLVGLKELVKKNGHLDREVDFQRKSLRSQYLRLLLSHPYAKEAKDVETSIWMHTSYQFIAGYRQRIGTLDRKLFASQAPQSKHGSRQDSSGIVEYRKTLHRFRQFLAEEEKLYSQLLVRLHKQFDLHETRATLAKLALSVTDGEDESRRDTARAVLPEQHETDTPTTEQRDGMLVIFAKFLVCLGDIARYREYYNDSGGRPRAGCDEGMPRKAGRGGKKGTLESVPRPRNYQRPRQMYEQARLLAPDDGNASHQLAVVASYEKDNFSCVFHYYRALCVRSPYDPATNNLNLVFRKASEQYRAANREEKNEGARKVPRLRVDRFKEWIVLLHGLWFLDSDESAANAIKFARNVISEFKALIYDRILQPELVSEVILLAFSALWKLRIIRDPVIPLDSPRNKTIESLMAVHVLDLARTLFKTGSSQLADLSDSGNKDELGQRIPALLRRTLPAIRITSRWLRSNLSYVMSATVPSNATSDQLVSAAVEFWKAYTEFLGFLNDTFPVEKLPECKGPLEEDVEMNGFSPIKKSVIIAVAATEDGVAPDLNLVHPNEAFLMRISDLLKDAHFISDIEDTPIVYRDGKFEVWDRESTTNMPIINSPTEGLSSIQEHHPEPPRVIQESDDDNTTQTSRTEDDPVGDAFRTALDNLATDEEDEIVWDPRATVSPPPYTVQVPALPPQQLSPVSAGPLAHLKDGKLGTRECKASTTAQDLLNTVLGNNFRERSGTMNNQRRPSDVAHALPNQSEVNALSSAPQPSLLFGSGSPRAPTTSIWTSFEGGLGTTTNVPASSAIHSHRFAQTPGHGRSPSFSNLLAHHTPPLNTSSQFHTFPSANYAQPQDLGSDGRVHPQPDNNGFIAPRSYGYDEQTFHPPIGDARIDPIGSHTSISSYHDQLSGPSTFYDSQDTLLSGRLMPYVEPIQRPWGKT